MLTGEASVCAKDDILLAFAERSAADTHWDAPKWTALILDHRLRAESADEAATAVQQAKELGFEAVLLKVCQYGQL